MLVANPNEPYGNSASRGEIHPEVDRVNAEPVREELRRERDGHVQLEEEPAAAQMQRRRERPAAGIDRMFGRGRRRPGGRVVGADQRRRRREMQLRVAQPHADADPSHPARVVWRAVLDVAVTIAAASCARAVAGASAAAATATHENIQKKKTGRNLMPSPLLVVGLAVARRNRDRGDSAQPWRALRRSPAKARARSRALSPCHYAGRNPAHRMRLRRRADVRRAGLRTRCADAAARGFAEPRGAGRLFGRAPAADRLDQMAAARARARVRALAGPARLDRLAPAVSQRRVDRVVAARRLPARRRPPEQRFAAQRRAPTRGRTPAGHRLRARTRRPSLPVPPRPRWPSRS